MTGTSGAALSCSVRALASIDCFEHDNSHMVMKQCPASCGLCTAGCHDTNAECKAWARDGACHNNFDLMRRNCTLSCGLCTTS